MAPPFPPKPKIGPLVRRTLFAAALGTTAGCGPTQQPIRIGPPPMRIGAEEYVEPPADAAPVAPPADAAFAKPPADAAAVAAPVADAGDVKLPDKPPPIRIGPPVRIDVPIRIGPPPRRDPIRIGARRPNPALSPIGAHVVDTDGRALARRSVRVELASGTRIVSTDADGAFTVDGLAPGEHAAVIHTTGYAATRATLDTTGARVTLAPAK